jgi:hypothetical protein
MTARILVVDDEPDLAALIQQKFHYQIATEPSAFRVSCLAGAIVST